MEYLSNDILYYISSFICKDSYASIGILNKRFHHLYETHNDLHKKTSIFYCISLDNVAHLYQRQRQNSHLDLKNHFFTSLTRSIVDDENVDIFRWCRTNLNRNEWVSRLGKEMIGRAARQGKLSLVKEFWTIIFERSFTLCTEEICSNAGSGGHVKVLEWAKKNGCLFHEYVSEIAASHGRLCVLMFLKENGCKIDDWVSSCAASNGHIEILEWLMENGLANLNEDVFTMAAKFGDLRILDWLQKNKCPWDEEFYEMAAQSANICVLEWSKRNGYLDVGSIQSERIFASAAWSGDIATLSWLKQERFSYDGFPCIMAAKNGHLSALRWLVENGYPYNALSCYNAASESNHTKVMEWIGGK